MIGIIGAMDVEVRNLISVMEDKEAVKLPFGTYYKGRIDGVECAVVSCGIGKVAAAVAAQTMILRFRPDLILNTGVAGTLSPHLSVGDVAISCATVEHDMDTSPLGDPVGLISGMNKIYMEADPRAVEVMRAAAKAQGVKCEVGTVASGDQFIADPEKKAWIREKFGAVCCEMEGGAIGHVCTLADVPFLVVRAISDSADGSAEMDYPSFVAMAAERSYKLTRAFLSAF